MWSYSSKKSSIVYRSCVPFTLYVLAQSAVYVSRYRHAGDTHTRVIDNTIQPSVQMELWCNRYLYAPSGCSQALSECRQSSIESSDQFQRTIHAQLEKEHYNSFSQ